MGLTLFLSLLFQGLPSLILLRRWLSEGVPRDFREGPHESSGKFRLCIPFTSGLWSPGTTLEWAQAMAMCVSGEKSKEQDVQEARFSQLASNMQPHWARISKTVNSVCRPGVLVCLGNAPIAKNSMTCRDNRDESMKVPTQVQSGTGHDGR